MKRLLFVCLYAAPFLLAAQNPTISLSKKFSLKDLDIYPINGPTYKIGDFFYSLDIDWKGMQFAYTAKLDKIKYAIILHQYDQQMKEVKRLDFQNKKKDFGPFAPKVILFQGQLLLFYYTVTDDQAINLSMGVIDPTTLREIGHKDLYKIVERNVGMFKMEHTVEHNKLILRFSQDSSHLLVAQSGNTDEIFTCAVNSKLDAERPVTSRIRQGLDDFACNDGFIDNSGNRYLSYTYAVDKMVRSGVVFQKDGVKDSFLDLKQGQKIESADKPRFVFSGDGSTLYLYVTTLLDEVASGFAVAKIDAGQQKMQQPLFFPFPMEFREWMHKEGYRSSAGDKNDFLSSVTFLKDGTMVISGYPSHTTNSLIMYRDHSLSQSIQHAGPIVNAFIKGDAAGFGIVYRKQELSNASGFVTVPMEDKLIVLYNDGEKNVLSTEPLGNRKTYSSRELVLAEAIVGPDQLVSKTKISNKEVDGAFLLSLSQRLGDKHFLIPVGHDTYNMSRYYLLTEQWANVEVR